MSSFPLTPALATIAQAHRLPGLAVATHWQATASALTYGHAALEPLTPLSADTVFPLGSITKTVTATLCVMLAERGHLDLDAPVQSILADFRVADPGVSRHVTTRHLLTHTAGFDAQAPTPPLPQDAALAEAVAALHLAPQRTPVGEYSYADVNHLVAGRIIEVLTGQPYEQAAHRLLLGPLGLRSARFLHASEEEGTTTARGYTKTLDGRWQPYAGVMYGRYIAPTGGLCLSVSDTLQYLTFVLRGGVTAHGQRLLGEEALAELVTPRLRTPRGDGVTLAWVMTGEAGTGLLQQRCSFGGINGVAFVAPERQFAGVIFNNAFHGLRAQTQVMQLLLKQLPAEGPGA
ncbi:beta-lactamase [Deinococcus phoenicis]|uniref:Beta-lactamase n=1 Tax=Deinococcus phoenicis TaxID=1476583 RepID=A0A016QQA5_9DEIO|nr:serine hydrolase domain-containing protein [Deinococcus phoenicis]EYB68161.1 beta-lactamase [Deinococcus phoenicis]